MDRARGERLAARGELIAQLTGRLDWEPERQGADFSRDPVWSAVEAYVRACQWVYVLEFFQECVRLKAEKAANGRT